MMCTCDGTSDHNAYRLSCCSQFNTLLLACSVNAKWYVHSKHSTSHDKVQLGLCGVYTSTLVLNKPLIEFKFTSINKLDVHW